VKLRLPWAFSRCAAGPRDLAVLPFRYGLSERRTGT